MATQKELEQNVEFMVKYLEKGANALTGGIQDVVYLRDLAVTLRKTTARLSGIFSVCEPDTLQDAITFDAAYGLCGAVETSNPIVQFLIMGSHLDVIVSELVRQCDEKLQNEAKKAAVN